MTARALVLAGLLLAILAAPARAVTIETVTGANGVTAWLVEDHSARNVSIRLAFKGGAAMDPKGKEGVAELVSGLLDEGAGEIDSATFHAKLEDLTASFQANAQADDFVLASRVESSRLDGTVELLHLALSAPRFDVDAVTRIRDDVRAEIAEEMDRPSQVADLVWRRAVFGDHPYSRAWLGTPESLGRIEIADLRKFVHDRFALDNVVIGIVGDVTPAGAKQLVDKLLDGLPAHATPDGVADTAPQGGGEILLARMDVPQSVAIFGEAGIARKDPDWYATALIMHILGGGGFDARLTEEVRVKRGLAYSIEMSADPMLHAPLLFGEVATRNAKVAEALQVIRDQVKRMRDDGPTEAELNAAKTYLTGSFPLGLDSTQRIASLLCTIQREHLGIDYLDRRNALFERVTLEQAQRVAKRLLDPDKLVFAVVGDPDTLPGAKPAPAVE